jgi:hypothetical protein
MEQTMATAVALELEPWRELVRLDFTETPGLRLTLPQAQRLWCLDRDLCKDVLDSLVETRFLTRVDTRYCRTGGLDASWLVD